MAPTNLHVFDVQNFKALSDVYGVPRGELFHVSINPHTGAAVICYQNSPAARAYLHQILFQLVSDGFFAGHEVYEEVS